MWLLSILMQHGGLPSSVHSAGMLGSKDQINVQLEMVLSQNRGPQYRPQNTIVLIIGIPKKVPLILGNPQISMRGPSSPYGRGPEIPNPKL